MKKRILSCLLAVLLAAALAPAALAAQPITVTIDGVPIAWTDATPFVDENGRTMVPLRPVAEAMGLIVEWDQETQTAAFVEAWSDTDQVYVRTVGFTIGEKIYYGLILTGDAGGEPQVETMELEMDTVPLLKDGRTYAPLRYLAEFFDYDVQWEQSTLTVALTSPDRSTLIYEVVWTDAYDFLVYFLPGVAYDGYYGIRVQNVTVNGTAVPITVLPDQDYVLLRDYIGAETAAAVVCAFGIDQKLPNGTHDIHWEVVWLDENGIAESVQKMDGTYTLTDDTYLYLHQNTSFESLTGEIIARAAR